MLRFARTLTATEIVALFAAAVAVVAAASFIALAVTGSQSNAAMGTAFLAAWAGCIVGSVTAVIHGYR